MESPLIEELITEVAEDFKIHLATAGNDRIIFSGRFGKGKTRFLTTFFDNQEKYLKAKQYNVFFLDFKKSL
ncbi:MAG: hypothetical protein JWN78_835 [Bacteroidota bacterium]|nr:hypothetical protein [Bacteroidota bacterium]